MQAVHNMQSRETCAWAGDCEPQTTTCPLWQQGCCYSSVASDELLCVSHIAYIAAVRLVLPLITRESSLSILFFLLHSQDDDFFEDEELYSDVLPAGADDDDGDGEVDDEEGGSDEEEDEDEEEEE